MIRKYFPQYTLFFLSLLLFSCGGNNQGENPGSAGSGEPGAAGDSSAEAAVPQAEMVISDIPFPFEVLDNLHTAGISYDEAVMNPLNNISKYDQYNSKALNLGVCGADLAYVVTYEQFQQIGVHVKAAKKLAEDLNIPFAFSQNMLDRYSKYKDNKDSLRQIVYDSYSRVDKTLKNDERVGIAALVVTGSWLEGLYLSSKTFADAEKTKANAGLYKTISGQKKSLAIVVKLLGEYRSDPYILGLMNDLDDIASSYDTTGSNVTLNDQQLAVINAKVEKLRSRIIEGL